MKSPTALFALLLLSLLSCCPPCVKQGCWKSITFMDCDNVTHHVCLCVTGARYDRETGYLRVDGRIRNLQNEERRFNLRNWVVRLDEHGKYLKAKCVGLPVVVLQPKRENGTSREETFALLFKLEPSGFHSNMTIDYADQFFLTGQINKIILSVLLTVDSGTVSARG